MNLDDIPAGSLCVIDTNVCSTPSTARHSKRSVYFAVSSAGIFSVCCRNRCGKSCLTNS
jgi:hypothetical protein